MISREDFLRYRDDYEKQEKTLENQLAELEERMRRGDKPESGWVQRLLEYGRLTELDRPTIAGTINEIKIFEGGRIEIAYRFSEELSALLGEHT